MFRGTAQGAGVECYWNDPRLSKEDGGLWRADDAQTELENYFTVAATAPESPQLTVPKVKKGQNSLLISKGGG
jgi:hypothetical protein